jgi:hypothetical protein
MLCVWCLCVGCDLIMYHLVLFSVLEAPCACFPSLQFILFAICALVDCNGFTVEHVQMMDVLVTQAQLRMEHEC